MSLIYRIWDKIYSFPYQIKWFIQRGRRGWSDDDVLGLDYYLASWLPDALREFKKSKTSCPIGYFDENASGGEECHLFDDELDKMIEGFEAARRVQNHEFNFHSSDLEELKAKIDIGLESFKKNFLNLWY